MGYIQEFRKRLADRDLHKLVQLWDEYCENDVADGQEIIEIFQIFKNSDLAKQLKEHLEKILPQIQQLQSTEYDEAMRLLIDVQPHNSEALAKLTFDFIEQRFGSDPYFNEKIRLVGLRSKENFQGAISNYVLLNHIEKGNFVLHAAGWGVGEIIEYSRVREQLTVEFENLSGGKRDISFRNAFKTLIPVSHTHFLALRFAAPEQLQEKAKNNPTGLIKDILNDLGPCTASQIKDELTDLVISEKEYAKWWQSVRTKLKKETSIETPDNPKAPFQIRKGEFNHSSQLEKSFANKWTPSEILLSAYSFARDMPEALKKPDIKQYLIDKIQELLNLPELSEALKLQIFLFLEAPLGVNIDGFVAKDSIVQMENLPFILEDVEIVALKKRILILIRENRPDWQELFLVLLFKTSQNPLKDYILKELMGSDAKEALCNKLAELIAKPTAYPDALYWYFQKLIHNEDVPLNDKPHVCLFFESLLLLFSATDLRPEWKDLSKKIYHLLTNNKFEVTRALIKDSNFEFIQEFLLLVSKCRAFNDHDQKILQSLAEVVHPRLAKVNKKAGHSSEQDIVWTTEAGYLKIQNKIRQIGTVDMIENAREIEAARALGDLRENSEFKFAMERKSRLQSELKSLSDQFNKARIITKHDIPSHEVGIGTKVTISNHNGENVTYTILGPWDADPDKSILSLQSKLAQAMIGSKTGEKFQFKDEEFTIIEIKSYLE